MVSVQAKAMVLGRALVLETARELVLERALALGSGLELGLRAGTVGRSGPRGPSLNRRLMPQARGRREHRCEIS